MRSQTGTRRMERGRRIVSLRSPSEHASQIFFVSSKSCRPSQSACHPSLENSTSNEIGVCTQNSGPEARRWRTSPIHTKEPPSSPPYESSLFAEPQSTHLLTPPLPLASCLPLDIDWITSVS